MPSSRPPLHSHPFTWKAAGRVIPLPTTPRPDCFAYAFQIKGEWHRGSICMDPKGPFLECGFPAAFDVFLEGRGFARLVWTPKAWIWPEHAVALLDALEQAIIERFG